MNEDRLFDVAVVGAGMGGLAAAALLAKRGLDVVVLEAMGIPGGCAQTFRRGAYRFDAGATTIVGVEPELPLGRLASALGVAFDLERIDPAMSVWTGGRRVDRHTDRGMWLDEASTHFGPRQREFWSDIWRTADRGWRVATDTTAFPPSGVAEWMRAAVQALPAGAGLLPSLVESTARRMRRRIGEPSPEFARFVDEQLLITAQAGAARVPFAVGSMGLSYTNLGNYAARGGVGALSETLVRTVREAGGLVRYGRRVERLERDADGFRLTTRRETIRARAAVCNLTLWDMAEVCEAPIADYFRRTASARGEAWGAITLYLGIEDTFGDLAAIHHQVIFDEPLPVAGGHSVFVSLSPSGDATRAPEGRRAATVSTHTPVAPWWEPDRERYEEAKGLVVEAMLDRIATASGLGRLRVETLLTGTPRTFVRYTHRARGRVGGIPSTFAAIARPVPSVTPFSRLYVVGDTVYPGQGIPAVVLGALNATERVVRTFTKSNRRTTFVRL